MTWLEILLLAVSAVQSLLMCVFASRERAMRLPMPPRFDTAADLDRELRP
ncbi:hypothetical protein [Tianweitania sediminis]|uniref:Uncharacterized protein n=1 Tax=Tianweitania sediminis TaxID=1502156 RepID=A0A8J7UHV6_9HYPH|nr:hypothetical protein [Tianweitania sediminis]MBP0439609.1 hypothetical protein [Tianweitania sediminis]